MKSLINLFSPSCKQEGVLADAACRTSKSSAQTARKWSWLLVCAIGISLSACDSEENALSTYDPSKPLVLTDYYPKEGPISTQVILNGSNFGNSKEGVKVFFNEKEASIISVKGERMLVLAPKLPGEECVIKVQVGDQEQSYEDLFDYIVQTNISTLVGGDKNAKSNPTGTVSLSEAQFAKKIEIGIETDAAGNVYFCVQDVNADGTDANNGSIYVLSEESGQLKQIKNSTNYFCNNPMLAYDPYNDIIYQFDAGDGSNGYCYFDVDNDFSEISMGSFTLPDLTPSFLPFTVRRAFAMNENGWFYCRGQDGDFYRVNPNTRQGEWFTDKSPLGGFSNGATYGAVFDPNDSRILYFSVDDRHCIYKYNIETDEISVLAGVENNGGYMDGEASIAKFNKPSQICFDSQGDLYVADRENNCIRKIAMSTGYVSTVAGIAGKAGYQNGTEEVALFDKPIGLAIGKDDVLYVGDSENRAIRRVAIE